MILYIYYKKLVLDQYLFFPLLNVQEQEDNKFL